MAAAIAERWITGEEWQPIPVGGDGLSVQEVSFLETEWAAVTGRDPGDYFSFSRSTITPKNWTGSIVARNVRLDVVPKGAGRLSPDERSALDRNLGHMLRVAVAGRTVPLSEASLSTAGTRFDQIVQAFCDLVLLARRKQRLRRYSVRTGWSRGIRGHLNFPSQAFAELERPGFFKSRWVELDQDRLENVFLKGVGRFCLPRATLNAHKRVQELLADFAGVPDVEVSPSDYHRIDLTRLPSEYVVALGLGRDLLSGRAAGFFQGSLTSRSEVVILPPVFEGFVGWLLKQVAAARGAESFLKRGDRFLGKWEAGPSAGRDCFQLTPDAELQALPAPILIDSKWKLLAPAKNDLGINEADLYQMVTYALRLGSQSALLVYPWMGSKPPITLAPPVVLVGDRETGLRIGIAIIPLLWDRLAEPMQYLESALAAVEGAATVP